MSVAELIEQLKQQPADMPVKVAITDRAGVIWWSRCAKVKKETKQPGEESAINPVISIIIC